MLIWCFSDRNLTWPLEPVLADHSLVPHSFSDRNLTWPLERWSLPVLQRGSCFSDRNLTWPLEPMERFGSWPFRLFQWSKSYVATWTLPTIQTGGVQCFSDRNLTWPLELIVSLKRLRPPWVSVIEILRGHLNTPTSISFLMKKVSVIEILRGHLNTKPDDPPSPPPRFSDRNLTWPLEQLNLLTVRTFKLFQWSKSYVTTWTAQT